ncbi:uncharacterized protein SPPG_08998 [Spizellomyces punctatus DAOM BR117]|uniref:Uncharacterized protein n=1 Tax=Spizellomyces punctatus (strain DAOM BR117) TaxID=645134 RepID=A0A0L0HQ25_SPIPD|nr:uncharacterized protein SPPG_08998 [Spizellomyces punctatus DAOM BR117]KND03133.1 hypothetical protein SPPG_08998 [Spizellomyces punctatus DAOM BR117]|eukprot:XP_016611172.1 hypothetical protein SPPG_08998 [Spizellomyces punctatus DAOM BR117]
MAYYRANYLSDTYAISPPIPNLQKRQVGVALDYSKIDILGRPQVVYSWNRNVHEKDLATKTNYAAPKYEPRLSSSDVLKLSAAQRTTKAYRDGLEYVKAEEDYRKKQKYLDSITPSRRGNALTVGTQNSLSGLPIPDESGHVFSYPASVTSQTGLMFEAPPNGNEIPAQPRNVNSTPLEPVILTRETEIRRDAVGNDHVNHGTGAAVPLDAMTMADAYIPPIPGSFPGLTPEVHVESPQIDASMETMPRSAAPIPHDTVLLNDRHDPSGVADVLERTPSMKNLSWFLLELHFTSKKQKTEPVTPPPDVIFAGVAPHGTKRRQYKQPDDKQTTVKRQRIDSSIPEREEVEEIRLTSPEEVEKHI